MKQVRVTDTVGFIALVMDASTRNRRPHDRLMKRLDIAGSHVVQWEMVHNDEELRCLWLVKVEGQDKPIKVWMDNTHRAIRKHTEMVEASGGG